MSGRLCTRYKDGFIHPFQVIHATVASYQNSSGYSYHRLLGFKPTCRKYESYRVDGWESLGPDKVRLKISGPMRPEEAVEGAQSAGRKRAVGSSGGGGNGGTVHHARHPDTTASQQPIRD
jgi:hypothetical protein